MGRPPGHNGYAHIDSVVTWCRDNGLYLILDMHDAPADRPVTISTTATHSPGSWKAPRAQKLFCDIWEQIATALRERAVILGYELINEPMCHYFDAKDTQRQARAAAQTCRRSYPPPRQQPHHAPWRPAVEQQLLKFHRLELRRQNHVHLPPLRRRTHSRCHTSLHSIPRLNRLPMYMGEIGHNTDEWQAAFCDVLEDNNIGYTFWPYKKVDSSCMNGITRPPTGTASWPSPRLHATPIRPSARLAPDTALARKALREFVENSRFENCTPQNPTQNP